MNTNSQKHQLIAKLHSYWEQRYPDAFLIYPTGEKVARDDLLDYFQDQEICSLKSDVANLYGRVSALESAPVATIVRGYDDRPIRDAVQTLESRLNRIETTAIERSLTTVDGLTRWANRCNDVERRLAAVEAFARLPWWKRLFRSLPK